MIDSCRVKIIRDSIKMTMEEFGSRLGVTRSAISNIEKGNRGVTEQMSRAICREFGVSEIWLRTGQGKIFITETDDEKYKKAAKAIACGNSDLDRIIRQTLVYYYEMDSNSKVALLNYIENIAALLLVKNKKGLFSEAPDADEMIKRFSNEDVG